MHWLNGESSRSLAGVPPAKTSKLSSSLAGAGGASARASGGDDGGAAAGKGKGEGEDSRAGSDVGDDSIPCEADCGDEGGANNGARASITARGDGDSSPFDLTSEAWEHAPNPRPDQLPQGASRNTWPNIVNNKKNVSPPPCRAASRLSRQPCEHCCDALMSTDSFLYLFLPVSGES